MKREISVVATVLALTLVCLLLLNRQSNVNAYSQADSMVLTTDEQKEAELAFKLEQTVREGIGKILDEAASVTYSTENALIVFGKLREVIANLRTAQAQRVAILERHRTKRPACSQCDYSPDLKSLVKTSR